MKKRSKGSCFTIERGKTMRMPSLSALRAFDAAARLGSFKSAAEELEVTPAAISHQIRSLEDQLGFSLFLGKYAVSSLLKKG